MDKYAFEAIIFDHDGTLVDTESADFRAYQMLYTEFGATLNLEYWAATIVGRMNGYDDLFAELARQSNNGVTAAGLWRRIRELWLVTLEDVELMPGVTTLLPTLQAAGYPLAVATASDQDWTRRWLTRFELLPYFQTIATRNEVVHNKPAPDVYLLAAAQLGVDPGRCLVFEDSLAGVQSATAAGMTVVAVPNHLTRVLDFSQAHAMLNSLEEVTLDWLEALALTKRPP